MSDTSRAEPHPIRVDRRVNARELSRSTAVILNAVADEGHSFAVEHHGRVVGFLVPRDGRVPVKRRGRVVYEVPEPEPVLELTSAQVEILRILSRDGRAVPDELVPPDGKVGDTLVALGGLEMSRLIVKRWMGYELTPVGARHVEELGL